MQAQTNKRIPVGFRGLGDLGAKTVYFGSEPQESKPSPDRRFFFKQGIVKNDEITRNNLSFLCREGFLERATLFVHGDRQDIEEIKKITSGSCEICHESEFSPDVAVMIDFTPDAKPIRHLSKEMPLLVQHSNNGLGILHVQPIIEERVPGQEILLRMGECSLTGMIPFLSRATPFFEDMTMHVLATRRSTSAASPPLVLHFSDSHSRRMSRAFGTLLGIPTTATYSCSEMIGAFYTATIAGRLNMLAIEDGFGSRTKFDKANGFETIAEKESFMLIDHRDSTVGHASGKAKCIQEVARRYPSVPAEWTIYFSRTFERNGDMVSFHLGFNIDVCVAVSNLWALDGVLSERDYVVHWAATAAPTLSRSTRTSSLAAQCASRGSM